MEVVSHFRGSRRRVLQRSGIAGALAAGILGFSPFIWAQTSPCNLGANGVNNGDYLLAIPLVLASATSGTPCTLGIESATTCTVISVQRIYDWDNGQLCITYNTHAANLSWTASTTPNVGSYNVYRATASTGPWTQIQTSVSGTTFSDNATTNAANPPQAGQTYYYAVTAVANGVESAQSSPPVAATIPSP
jgi:hypothetical protein